MAIKKAKTLCFGGEDVYEITPDFEDLENVPECVECLEETLNEINLLIEGLTTRLNALANSDDATLDQLAEVVAYIKANRTLIESVTTGKVSVSDIIDNLATNVANKPLSAAQGVALKKLIDALQTAVNNIKVPTKLSELEGDSTHRTVTDAEKDAWNKKQPAGDYVTEEGLTSKGYAKSTDLGKLSEEIVDKMDKTGTTLGLHTDGLIYVFVDGQPIGTGVAMATAGGDVVGMLDSNNNIILTGNLADGTYTLKYENADGSYTDIGIFDVGELFDSGLFDASTALLNNRLNSSGLPKTDNGNGGVVSDFIPYVHGTNKELYIKNANIYLTDSMPYTKIAFYNASKTYLGCTEFSNSNNSAKVTILGDKYEKVALEGLTNASSASFIRVVLCPNGNTTALTEEDIADIIMKYDEEIA